MEGGHAIGVIPRQRFDNAIGVTHRPELVEGELFGREKGDTIWI